MKKFVALFAAVLLVAVVTAPAFAQQQAPKGTRSCRMSASKSRRAPKVRMFARRRPPQRKRRRRPPRLSPPRTRGPDVRKKPKKKTASSVAPKGTEGPDVRNQAPKGTEGPDVRKGQPNKAQ